MENIMEYELINPSDPYTFLAESFEVAVLTVFCISTAYGAKSKDGEKEVPLFIFGGSEAWFLGEFHKTVEESLNENKRAVADALDSFIIQPKNTPTSKRSLGGAMNSLIISSLVLIRIIEISFLLILIFSYFYIKLLYFF